jgi:enediyne biosynthesis protein E4
MAPTVRLVNLPVSPIPIGVGLLCFLKYKGDYYFEKGRAKEKADTFHLVSTMTSTPVHNYMFRNNGGLTFTDKSKDWGFGAFNFSSGGSYSDLDNDGDLDLVTNNQNESAGLYKNMAMEQNPNLHYLSIKLKGTGKNLNAIGSKVYVCAGNQVQYFEMISTRGFQSSVSSVIHVGLGSATKIDSVLVKWPFKGETVLRNISANQLLTIHYDHKSEERKSKWIQPQTVFSKMESVLPYEHVELGFNDFKRQPLLLTMLTTCGPVMTTADVNGDGLADVYVGGTQDNPGKIYLQTRDGDFVESTQLVFADDKICTDADATFFDADGDRDLDLYVVSGGYNDYTEKDPALQDRLYLNNGRGLFSKSSSGLPMTNISKSSVASADFDKDGDMDLFVGGRVIPGKYPEKPKSFLFQNNGKGSFQNIIAQAAPSLFDIGMVTDAKWIDFNKDGWMDLIVVGEFMAVEVFINKDGKTLESATQNFFDSPLQGLWTKMLTYDFDKDGDDDVIVGNFGLNSQLKASEQKPLSLVYKDFDKNGSIDPFLVVYIEEKPYPFASRDELLDQMYSMRSRFTSYAAYSEVQMENLFTKADLADAKVLSATTLKTIYLENANGKLVQKTLPGEAQFSPTYAMAILDYNADGNMDFILGGNQSSIRIRMGVIDANFGQLFEGDGKGNFKYISQEKSGLVSTGDVKSMSVIKVRDEDLLLIGINNVGVQTYKLNQNKK